jgi:hypothetical protein
MLWVLRESHWRLPIEVGLDEARIATVRLPKMPWLKAQRTAVNTVLDRLAFSKGEDACWFVIGEVLDQHCDGTDKTDPEECVAWSPNVYGEYPVDNMPSGVQWVVEQLVVAGLARTSAAAWLLYQAVCRFWMQQLVNRDEAIDLLFCKLHPMPYRVNWKTVLLYRKSNLQRIRQKLERELTADDLLAYNEETKTIRWNLEVVPSRWWIYCTNARERLRKRKTKWKNQYWYEISRLLWQRVVRSGALYRSWLCEIVEPHTKLPRTSWSPAYPGGLPTAGEVGMPVKVSLVGDLPVELRDLPEWRDRVRHNENVAAANAAWLPKVPDLQSGVEDVRNGG